MVPIQCDTTEEISCPINGDGVKVFEGIDVILGMFLANIFYAEDVDNEVKKYWPIFVAPQAKPILEGLSAIIAMAPGELVMCKT